MVIYFILKDVLVAVGVRGSTLRHAVCDSNQSWLTQVFLNPSF